MNKDQGVWTYQDAALVLIDYQKEMFENIRSETPAPHLRSQTIVPSPPRS